MKKRLQKILSERGIASRRAAEAMILAGRITVDGVQATIGTQADPQINLIELDGHPLKSPDPLCYLALYKPRGVVTTVCDELGRKTVLDLLSPDDHLRVYPVGRLDLDSEGLLLLTNDGELCQSLIHPSKKVDKTYLVWVRGNAQDVVNLLNKPMRIDGVLLHPAKAIFKGSQNGISLLQITIHEGKNRQIRKMCIQVGLTVLRLKRISIGPISIGKLRPGQYRTLTDREISMLKRLGGNSHE